MRVEQRVGVISKVNEMDDRTTNNPSKVPAVTLAFWVTKILATTLGETGGDAVSMSFCRTKHQRPRS